MLYTMILSSHAGMPTEAEQFTNIFRRHSIGTGGGSLFKGETSLASLDRYELQGERNVPECSGGWSVFLFQ